MKHIKTFENINIPQVGDYVIMNFNANNFSLADNYLYTEYIEFVNNTIGKIIKIEYDRYDKYKYIVTEYENVPDSIRYHFNKDGYNKFTDKSDVRRISAFSRNKEDLEIILQAKKYNL